MSVIVDRVRIVGLGDSTTAGTPGFRSPVEAPPEGSGDEKSQYAYWLMKSHQDWRVFNVGINGERTDQILERFDRDVTSQRPKIVIVLGGVNDIYQGVPVKVPEQNLSRMYERTMGIDATPIACSVLPYNTMSVKQAEARRELNHWIVSKKDELPMPYCDTAAAVSDPQNPDRLSGTPDGLHPDVEGYKRMASALAMEIERILQA